MDARERTPMQRATERIRAVIKERVQLDSCACCGSMDWGFNVTMGIVQLIRDFDDPADTDERGMPLILCSCGYCGNTIFFNVWRLGLASEIPELVGYRKDDTGA